MPKDEVKSLIEKGIPCFYGYGLWNNSFKPITKEKALELLPKYYFGMGFHTLIIPEDKSSIKFKELSETDLW